MSEKKKELDLEELNKEFKQEMEALDIPGDSGNNSGAERRTRSRKKEEKKGRKKSDSIKKVKPFYVVVIILLIVLFLLFATIAALFIMRNRGKDSLKQNQTEEVISAPEDAVVEDEGKLVVYKGERYCYNENVISILCMGVDKTIQEEETDNVIGENGQADTLFLAVFDAETGQMSLLNISRDSMVDVNRYNVEGQYLGTEEMQVCLAYAYGDGKGKSCENVATSVSRLLYGMPINAYVAMDYSGISVLNDEVGGVTIKILEDMTGIDPELSKGAEVTLTGEQAHDYVRRRDTSELDSNNDRMERQKQYLLAFIDTVLKQTQNDVTTPVKLYRSAKDYMVTDIDVSEVTYLASQMLRTGFSEGNMYSVPGKVIMGEKYAEFYPKEKKLYELILNLFYNKQN